MSCLQLNWLSASFVAYAYGLVEELVGSLSIVMWFTLEYVRL